MTATRLRHASPWVIDTRAFSRQPGTMKQVELTAPAPAHLGTPVLQVAEGSDIALALRLESVTEGVLVSGRAWAVATGQCARCLVDIEIDLDVPVRELYAYPGSTTAATTDDGEVPRLVDDLIDLRQLVHDELVLAMPLAPLCAQDCLGLCLECGQRLDELGPDHRHERLDPRWAALAARSSASTAGPGEGTPSTEITGGASSIVRTSTSTDSTSTTEGIEEN